MNYRELPKEQYDKMMKICRGRNCSDCPLKKYNKCYNNITPEIIDNEYDSLFNPVCIQENDILNIIGE